MTVIDNDPGAETVRAPCGCYETRFANAPVASIMFYCDEHFAMCEASTTIAFTLDGIEVQGMPSHLEAIDAVAAWLRACGS